MTDTDDLQAAWDEVFEGLPAAWSVGRPSYHDERHQGVDVRLRSKRTAQRRGQERGWTAIADREVGVLLQMAWCPRELGEGYYREEGGRALCPLSS